MLSGFLVGMDENSFSHLMVSLCLSGSLVTLHIASWSRDEADIGSTALAYELSKDINAIGWLLLQWSSVLPSLCLPIQYPDCHIGYVFGGKIISVIMSCLHSFWSVVMRLCCSEPYLRGIIRRFLMGVWDLSPSRRADMHLLMQFSVASSVWSGWQNPVWFVYSSGVRVVWLDVMLGFLL